MELTLVNAGTEHVDPKFKDFLSEVKKKEKSKKWLTDKELFETTF